MVTRQPEERVLISAPLGSDAASMAGLLEAAGIATRICSDLLECVGQIAGGAGVLLLTEESLERAQLPALLNALKGQPPWSELPIIILTQGGESRISTLMEVAATAAGAVTLLERPMSAATLLRSVEVALRSRHRQYQIRNLLADQERQQQELLASERFKESLLNSLPAEIVALDSQGVIIAVNEPWQRFAHENAGADLPRVSLGTNYLEVCQRAVAVGDTFAASALEGIQSVLAGRSEGFSLEYPCHAPTRKRWFLMNVRPLNDGQGALLSHLDITERREVQEALRISQERLSLATEATGYGTFDFHPQTGELIWSAHAKRHFGLSPGASIDFRVFLQGLHPADRDRVEATVKEALRPENGGVYRCEYRTIGIEDGQERWIQATGRVFFNEAGQALRLIGGTVDITRQKAFQTELERLVAERTARLQELVGELEHFSYTITHDMRAPLRSMQGYAELVQELGPESQSEQKMLLKRIAASAQRMDLLITDALSYSKAVRQDLPLGPVAVSALLEGMLETYPEFQAAREAITLQQDIPVVFGNEAGLTQCFSNLITNALKFVAPGRPPKVRIWAESLPARPEEPSPVPGLPPPASVYGWVRIWVEDNGIGISQTMRPRIFNMFSRGTHEFEGTGIGLALVRKVADRMAGRVGVESEPGKGSRFWIELHAYASGNTPPVAYPKAAPGAGSIL